MFDSNWHSEILIDFLHIILPFLYLFMMTGHIGTLNSESSFPVITLESFTAQNVQKLMSQKLLRIANRNRSTVLTP